MSRTAVICTSTSGLTAQSDIPDLYILPLHVLFGEKDLLDCIQLSTSHFQHWMQSHPDQVATTAPPHPSEIRNLFDSLIRAGYTQVLALTLSSHLSQSYVQLHGIAQEYQERLAVHIFDTQTGGPGEALLAVEALRQVQRGAALPGIITRLKLLRSKSRTFLTVGKLNYLVRAGLLSAPAGFFGDLLKMHPVLHIQDGEIKLLHRVRTMERALEDMVLSAIAHTQGKTYEWYIIESGTNDTAKQLQDIMKTHGIAPTSIVPMTSVIAANTGSDGVGLTLWSPS